MTTMHWTAKALVVGLIAGLGAVEPVAAANLTPEESAVLTAPLAPDDPRAQTDPALLEAPEMQAPAPGPARKVGKRVARRTVEHDLASGETKVVRTRRAKDIAERGTVDNPGSAAGDAQSPGPEEGPPTVGASPGITPKVIWGADERARVTPTTSFPWRAHTKLFMTFPNGRVFMCSGTLIAAKYVITAGHCVNSGSDGGWATRIEVIPGYDNGYRPFGTAFATRLRSDTGWTTYRMPEYDFALLTLDRTIGYSTGWFGLVALGDITLYSHTANISGYPGDLCGGHCQFYDWDPVSWVLATTIYYNTDTNGGNSGSSVYSFVNGSRQVIAVHRGMCAGRPDKNCGVRMTGDRASRIIGWINSGI